MPGTRKRRSRDPRATRADLDSSKPHVQRTPDRQDRGGPDRHPDPARRRPAARGRRNHRRRLLDAQLQGRSRHHRALTRGAQVPDGAGDRPRRDGARVLSCRLEGGRQGRAQRLGGRRDALGRTRAGRAAQSQDGGGSISNVSSSGALKPLPQVVPYGSSKAALNAMSRSLAHEYGPSVRVNTISPGPFRTDIARAWPDEGRGPMDLPRGHAGDPHDIVTAALFLASPASVNVTGALVRCDGGQH